MQRGNCQRGDTWKLWDPGDQGRTGTQEVVNSTHDRGPEANTREEDLVAILMRAEETALMNPS